MMVLFKIGFNLLVELYVAMTSLMIFYINCCSTKFIIRTDNFAYYNRINDEYNKGNWMMIGSLDELLIPFPILVRHVF